MPKRGFDGMMMNIIGVVIAIIMIYTVIQPVTNSMILPNAANNAPGQATFNNLSAYSTGYLVSQQLPTFISIVGLVVIAGLAISMFRS